MPGAGVDYAVVVHPEPYQADHRYLGHCLGVGPGRLKGTCLIFADRTGSAAQLPELVKRGGVVAVRVHAYAHLRFPRGAGPARDGPPRALGVLVGSRPANPRRLPGRPHRA